MRFIFGLVMLSVFTGGIQQDSSAQPWLQASMLSGKSTPSEKPNFFRLQEKFNAYWKDRNANQLKEEENASDGGYQQYKRWEWFMKQRTWPSGNFYDPTVLFREYQKVRQSEAVTQSRARSRTANWSFIGPDVVPNSGGGAGRINVLRFDPSNPNILYIGAAAGGVWKSTDGGASWNSNTDFLTALSVADIAINPRYPDSVYVATGDGYGYEVNGDFWGGTYSAGVLVSPDGGQTWNPTGLTYVQDQTDIIQRLVIHPLHPEIMLVATRSNIFRSDNSGATWSVVRSGHFYDIEFNTANPDTVYASNSSAIYRSSDAGLTWSMLYPGLCGGRISIGVTPADPLTIYAFCESGNFFRSRNGGQTFTATVSSPQSATTFYGYYDAVLAVSPVDPNTVYCGGVNVVSSIDGGDSWFDAANQGPGTYVHADNHFIDFAPNSNNTVYSCNDGGIFRTTDAGSHWTDLSNGLAIKQYYRMSQSSQDPYTIYAGAQDNGTDRLKNGVWDQVFGADGMECLVDYSDDNNVYVSYQYGNIQKSTDGGNNFSSISPSSGDWVTPYVIHPTDPQTLFAGYSLVYKSTNGGFSWSSISGPLFNGDIIALAISPSNPDYLYAASLDKIFRTSDGGTNWTDISPGLPLNDVGITYIAISSADPQHIWVTFTGYAAGEKVFTSTDGGGSWTNLSGSLPNIPVNCVVYQNFSDDVTYVGTDFGVYYRDSTLTDWIPYSSGLPNVIVDELEIQYGAGKLRAATYGRGLWEADLNSVTQITLDAGVSFILSPQNSGCDSVIQPVVRLKNFGADTLYSATINYKIDAGTVLTYAWSGTLTQGTYVDVSLPAMNVGSGTHSFTAFTTDPNGQPDQNFLNDSHSTTFVLNTLVVPVPVTEGFQIGALPPAQWTVEDSPGLLYLNHSVGGFGLSTTSMFADFYSISSGVAYLKTPNMDFSSLAAPVTLEFNLAYSVYGPTYHDSLIVSVSTDCGSNFNRLYAKGDASLATTAGSTSIFIPGAGDWRRDTIDLSAFIGNPNVMIRFETISGFGNDLYIDDINLYDNSNLVPPANSTSALTVFPNPSDGIFHFIFPGSGSDQQQLEIYDLTGRMLKQEPLPAAPGQRELLVNLNGSAAGMYYYRLLDASRVVSTGKLIRN